VTFNEQGKSQHVTIDSLVTNLLAGLTLFVREEAAATLIWADKASTWSGRAPLTGSSRAVRAAITQESGVVLAMIKTLSAVESPAVRTTATSVTILVTALITTLVHAEDTRFVALDVTELKLIIREDVGQTVPTSDPIDTTITQVAHPCFGIVVNEHSDVSDAVMLRQEVFIVNVAV